MEALIFNRFLFCFPASDHKHLAVEGLFFIISLMVETYDYIIYPSGRKRNSNSIGNYQFAGK